MFIRVIITMGGDNLNPKELIKILEADGWQLMRVRGSHHMYRHPIKSGMLIVPYHTNDMKPGTINQILKDAGLK